MPPPELFSITEDDRSTAEAEIRTKQHEVRYDLRDFTIDYIVQEFQNGLFYVPPYQREFIWNEPHKRRFIESVILGLPIPMMFVADMEDGHHREDFEQDRMRSEFDATMAFVEKHFPHGFAKGDTSRATPRVRFEALAVGTNLALRDQPGLEPRSVQSWLNSEEFRTHTTTHASNSGPRLRGRIEFVRDRLLGAGD